MTLNDITFKVDSIESALQVHATIPEFTKPADIEYFQNRYKDKTYFILVAYIREKPVGYLIAYDKFSDDSIYCWMVGVDPDYRKRGVLSKLMEEFETWVKSQKYHTIHVKTRKSRKGMAYFLGKDGYIPQNPLIEDIPEDDDVLLLQKNI